MNAPLALAFAAGLLAAFNPCGFALLPAYLAYFVGTSGDRYAGQRPTALQLVIRALSVSAALTVGFVVVFGSVGGLVSVASVQVSRFAPWLTVIIGAALVVLGLFMVAGRAPALALPKVGMGRTNTREAGLGGMVVFGASYATVSLSCTLPAFLAVVTTTFEQESIAGGAASFVAYALGMGAVVAVLSVSIALAQARVVGAMRRMQRVVGRVAGGLLVVAGAYATWYGIYELLVTNGHDDVNAGPVTLVADLSSRIGIVVGDTGPRTIGLFAVGFLAAVIAVAFAASRRSRVRRA